MSEIITFYITSVSTWKVTIFKVDRSGENLVKFHVAHSSPIWAGVPHGILRVIITILYENEFSKSSNLSPASKIFSRAFYFLKAIVIILASQLGVLVYFVVKNWFICVLVTSVEVQVCDN
jgi:hypothetical protein